MSIHLFSSGGLRCRRPYPWLGLLIVALTIPALVWRILDEEKLLKNDLPGYAEYLEKVRYRLVPYLW
jgi:protein-S-isoprenylcysteine O-methyltransferase Ste14